MSLRSTRPESRTTGVQFSPSGRSWAASTTEGLLIYSLDSSIHFDPLDLEMNVTSDSILNHLKQKNYLLALVTAFRLGEQNMLVYVYHRIPSSDIPLILQNLPTKYLDRFIKCLVLQLDSNPRLEYHLVWVSQLVKLHGRYLYQHSIEYDACLRDLYKGLTKAQNGFSKL